MKEAERVILELMEPHHRVFSIDFENGVIWRHKKFTRSGNRRVIQAKRAEYPVRGGYLQVRVAFFGKEYTAMAHSLIWIAANGSMPDDQEPNHKNGQHDDNRLSNLEALTHSENVKHSYDVLGHKRLAGEQIASHKLTAVQVAEIRVRLDNGEAKKALAREFQVSPPVIRKIARGENWKLHQFPSTADTGRRSAVGS